MNISIFKQNDFIQCFSKKMCLLSFKIYKGVAIFKFSQKIVYKS